jgi:uncharacterized caspase-like protein
MVRKAIDARRWQGHVDVPLVSGANQLDAYVRDASGLSSVRRSWSVYRLNDAPVTRLWVAAPDDQVMVFVSGHGFLSEDAGYYFGTWDVDPADPAQRGLSYDDLLSVFDGLQAHRRVLLLDTCHADELDADTPPASLPVLAMPDAKVSGSRGIGAVDEGQSVEVG